MSAVLHKSELSLEALSEYVFKETETYIHQINTDEAPVGYRREYAWIAKDGFLVRSPILVNGVEVSKKEQAEAEEEWLREQQAFGKLRSVLDYLVEFMRHYINKRVANKITRGKENTGWDDLFSFKLEALRYRFAGEQPYEGQKAIVLKSDFVPLNGKYAVIKRNITILVEPSLQQLLALTFKGNTIVRTPELHQGVIFIKDRSKQESELTMNMHMPIEGIWLPKSIMASIKIDTSIQHGSLSYRREFHSYAKSDVKVRLLYDDN